MRLLHTSDWHIGRRFEREPLEVDQRAFLAWLAQQVGEWGVDLVVVAGDIYDRSMPGEDAVDVLDTGLDALRAAGAEIVLIPGNHDSARRLGFGASRQALGGVHVFADTMAPPTPWVLRAGGEELAVLAIPFLDPLSVPAPRPRPDGEPRARSHANVLCDAVEAGLSALGSLRSVPTLAVAHGTVAGGWPSDSEKVLSIGGADVVDAAAFEGFDYVALGHLHRPQLVAGDPRRCYSGSPLPYSFSETQPKSVRLVDIGGGSGTTVRELAVPVGRPVITLEGELDQLLDDPAYAEFADHFVAARLTDPTTCVAPMERLQQRFSHVVNVRYVPLAQGAGAGATAHGVAAGATAGSDGEAHSPVDVVCAFLAEVRGTEPVGWERELVARAVDTSLEEAPA